MPRFLLMAVLTKRKPKDEAMNVVPRITGTADDEFPIIALEPTEPESGKVSIARIFPDGLVSRHGPTYSVLMNDIEPVAWLTGGRHAERARALCAAIAIGHLPGTDEELLARLVVAERDRDRAEAEIAAARRELQAAGHKHQGEPLYILVDRAIDAERIRHEDSALRKRVRDLEEALLRVSRMTSAEADRAGISSV